MPSGSTMLKPGSFLILLLALFICISSCQINSIGPDQATVIQMNPDEAKTIDLDSLFDEFTLVPLETNSQSLVGVLRGVQMLKNRILVQSLSAGSSELLIFDGRGKFIDKIKRGQGPGEVRSVQAFFADESDQTIWIADNNLLHRFTSSGQYLEQFASPVFNIMSLIRVDEVFYGATLMGTICSFSRDSLIWQKNCPKSENIAGVITLPGLVSQSGIPLLFSSDFRTAYKISHDTIIPSVIFEFGTSNLPLNGPVYNFQDPSTLDHIVSKGYVTGLSNFRTFKGGYVFTGGCKNVRTTFLHVTNRHKTLILNGLTVGLTMKPFPPVGTFQDFLIFKLSPDILVDLYAGFKSAAASRDLITAQKRYPEIFGMLDTLDINANPVFLIGKLRR